jgi:hypothetical protein
LSSIFILILLSVVALVLGVVIDKGFEVWRLRTGIYPLCDLVGHSWGICRCQNLGCSEVRHSWIGCVCRKCGEERHSWIGCHCANNGCKETRHKVQRCRCQLCGEMAQHDWSAWSVPGSRCIQQRSCSSCGQVERSAAHAWTGWKRMPTGNECRACVKCSTTEERAMLTPHETGLKPASPPGAG